MCVCGCHACMHMVLDPLEPESQAFAGHLAYHLDAEI